MIASVALGVMIGVSNQMRSRLSNGTRQVADREHSALAIQTVTRPKKLSAVLDITIHFCVALNKRSVPQAREAFEGGAHLV